MIVKLLTEHYLAFLSLKGGCRGSSESTLVKMSNCLKSHTAAQLFNLLIPIPGRQYGELHGRIQTVLSESDQLNTDNVLFGPRREKTCLRGF